MPQLAPLVDVESLFVSPALSVFPPLPSVEPVSVPALAAPSVASLEPEDRAEPLDARSLRAHPEPLKWTAGVLKPFFMVPSAPQLGQNRGPSSLIPWMTSVR
jgi:hypothetical protein